MLYPPLLLGLLLQWWTQRRRWWCRCTPSQILRLMLTQGQVLVAPEHLAVGGTHPACWAAAVVVVDAAVAVVVPVHSLSGCCFCDGRSGGGGCASDNGTGTPSG